MTKTSDDFIIVKVQKMFPNCSKYDKCCGDIKGFEVLENGELGKEVIKNLKTKKIIPVKDNPFPDEHIL